MFRHGYGPTELTPISLGEWLQATTTNGHVLCPEWGQMQMCRIKARCVLHGTELVSTAPEIYYSSRSVPKVIVMTTLDNAYCVRLCAYIASGISIETQWAHLLLAITITYGRTLYMLSALQIYIYSSPRCESLLLVCVCVCVCVCMCVWCCVCEISISTLLH